MRPVYIVSSFHRSGSSMMMRCLQAGGLEAVYDSFADAMNLAAPEDYTPNPNGFFQYNREVLPDFYESYNGKLVKLYFTELIKLPPGNYKVVFMLRDPVEIRASMERWTPYKSWGMQEAATYLYEEIRNAISTIPGVEVLFVNYVDVINNPHNEFLRIKEFGIPIQASLASQMVDPSLYRLKLEVN